MVPCYALSATRPSRCQRQRGFPSQTLLFVYPLPLSSSASQVSSRAFSFFITHSLSSACHSLSESVSLVITPLHHTMILCPSIISFLSWRWPAVSFVSLFFNSIVHHLFLCPFIHRILTLLSCFGAFESPTSGLDWKQKGVQHPSSFLCFDVVLMCLLWGDHPQAPPPSAWWSI